MSRIDTERTEGLRDIFGFRDKFDVVLACAFEPEEKGGTKFGLYEKIGRAVREIEKRPYLPHEEIDLQWPCEKIYTIPNRIVIPTSDIVLCYLGLPSDAAGLMTASALQNNIPLIYLFENDKDFQQLKVRIDTMELGSDVIDIGIKDHRNTCRHLEFGVVSVKDENVADLEKALRRFYRQPLFRKLS